MSPTLRTLLCCMALAAPVTALAQRGPNRQRIDTTVAFSGNGEVTVSANDGSVRITGWARNSVRVTGSAERAGLRTTVTTGIVRVEVRPRNGSAQLELYVPIGVRVRTSTRTADINVSGTQGDISITTAGGRITVSDGKGMSSIDAGAGRVTMQRFSGKTSVRTLTGSVNINEISGDLDITTITAPTTITSADLSSLRFEGGQGSLDFSGVLAAPGQHRIETLGGSVNLRFPGDFAATIAVASHNGRLHAVDFPVTLRPSGRGRRDEDHEDRQEFTINGGGTLISISTFNGGVFLRRLGAQNGR
jgi:hypothetical protein